MTHRDEKGRISPAQSKVARTLADKAEALGNLPASHDPGGQAGGRRVFGVSGMAAMAKENANPHVTKAWSEHRQKLKTIARGKANEHHKAYTKIGKQFHVKGLLKAPQESAVAKLKHRGGE